MFPETVLSTSASVPLLKMPPSLNAMFPETALSRSVSVPTL